jgi:choline-glycine betaine transporter
MKDNDPFYSRLAWIIMLTGLAIGVGFFVYCVRHGL